jgi:dihydrofolate reductase
MAALLSYSFPVSLDGYIANAKGEIGLPPPEEALHRHFNEQQERATLSIYGRRMYEMMRYWEDADQKPESSPVEVEFARAWQKTPKLVVSTTLTSVGPNARLLKTGVEDEVRKLKAELSGQLDVSGAKLANCLIRAGLVDEFRLYFMPVVLGGGTPYFGLGTELTLEPLGSESLPQGVTLLRFRPKK